MRVPSAGVDHPAAHLVAGASGHVAVEHGDVVAVDAEPLDRRVAVVADVDGHRELAQPVGDGVGEQPLVVGQQYAHVVRSPRVTDRPREPAGAPDKRRHKDVANVDDNAVARAACPAMSRPALHRRSRVTGRSSRCRSRVHDAVAAARCRPRRRRAAATTSTSSGWPAHGQAAYRIGHGRRAQSSPGQRPAPIASLAKVMTASWCCAPLRCTRHRRLPAHVISAGDVADTAAPGRRRRVGRAVARRRGTHRTAGAGGAAAAVGEQRRGHARPPGRRQRARRSSRG